MVAVLVEDVREEVLTLVVAQLHEEEHQVEGGLEEVCPQHLGVVLLLEEAVLVVADQVEDLWEHSEEHLEEELPS